MTATHSPAPYTARNRDRRPGAATVSPGRSLETTLRDSLRRAQALRVANRMGAQMRARRSGDPRRSAISRLEEALHGVRDAECFDRLLSRDQLAAGMIVGAYLFDGISLAEADRLHVLRDDAFRRRLAELHP